MLITVDKILQRPVIKSALWPQECAGGATVSIYLMSSCSAHMNAAEHFRAHTDTRYQPCPLFLLLCWRCYLTPGSAFPSPLSRRSRPQPPHPPYCAGCVPAAAHHRIASVVLPQVKTSTPVGFNYLTLFPPTPTPPCPSLTGY